ncbi:hypothetical protein [Streptomyces sp. bgisy027]|uniref:hypothetical protein n=1 Tax=Streptomyces sp. bgisy027 TaxID=3413770 RepID=UPI003D72F6C7
MVSLWPVRDSTGCLVMIRTHRCLADDPTASVGTALTRAQLEVRELPGAERDEEFHALAGRAGCVPGGASLDKLRCRCPLGWTARHLARPGNQERHGRELESNPRH